MSETKNLVEELKQSVASFNNANEERLKALEENKGVAELEAKVDKHVGEVLDVQKQLDEIKTIANRIDNKTEVKTVDSEEYKSAVNAYLAKGDNAPLMELKNFQSRIDTDGGFLVQPDVEQGIFQRVYETSPMRQVATVKTISVGEYSRILRKTQLSSGGWVNEGGTRSTTASGEYGRVTIPLQAHYAEPVITGELLDDSAINLETEILQEASEVLGREENTAFISGNGSGKPTGIISYDAWTTGGTYEFGKVEQVNTGDANLLTIAGVIELQNALKEEYQNDAVFMMQRGTWGAILKLNTANEYPFNNMFSMDQDGSPILLGKKVVFASDMQAVGANALSVAYGDFGKGYCIVDKLGTKIIRDPYTSKGNIIFSVERRVGGGVVDFDAIKIQKVSA